MQATVLVVDDEPLIRQSLAAALRREGYEVCAAASAAEATRMFAAERPDAVVLDLILNDGHGLTLLERMRADAPETKFVVITAQGSVEEAVSAMKLGAYDFVRKPFDLAEIIAGIRNALHLTELEGRVAYFAQRDRGRLPSQLLESDSPAMQRILAEARLIGGNDVPNVLILGESGTGKQLLARTLHESSCARHGAFVELNCAAMPDALIESELFGHERGAFSDAHARKLGLVEIAHEGTLFLDEVGDLSIAAQARLLKFLEQRSFRRLGGTAQKKVSVRVIAATNRDLTAMVQAKTFREDLWYRLSGMSLRIPPLRERTEDIPRLVSTFLQEANRIFGRAWQGVQASALAVLVRYRWPGNIRELRSVIHRLALMSEGELVDSVHLPTELIAAAMAEPEVLSDPHPVSGGRGIPTLAEVEAVHVRRVLAMCSGNKTAAAQLLGITRQTLAKKLGARE